MQESTKTASRAEAQKYEEMRRREIREQYVLGNKPQKTWYDAEVRWLKEKKDKRTILGDVSTFEWLEKYLKGMKLSDINSEVVEKIIESKMASGVTGATTNRTLALLKSVLNKAYKTWGWIDKVPYIRMQRESKGRKRYLDRHEIHSLIQALPDHLKQLFRFSLATGLRKANVTGLEWDNVDLERKLLTINDEDFKTDSTVSIPLNDEAINILAEQAGQNSRYVFHYKGQRIKECNTRAWRKALKAVGIKDFRWHDIRHTWASYHAMSGTPTNELKELGGWKSHLMPMRYAHLSQEHLVTAANRISKLFEPEGE